MRDARNASFAHRRGDRLVVHLRVRLPPTSRGSGNAVVEDAAEALVAEGVPFRGGHERVAGRLREGPSEPPESPPPRVAPGPADVYVAVAEARTRFDA